MQNITLIQDLKFSDLPLTFLQFIAKFKKAKLHDPVALEIKLI